VKLLIDNCLSEKLAQRLIAEGHDVETVAAWPSDPGDRVVLATAARAGRVLITADRGFGELVVMERLRNAGLIVLNNIPAAEHEAACRRALAEHETVLLAGGFVIVRGERIRARTPRPDA
jgi:predicted nuclease of predicted toxin-antitoxin system